MRRSFSLVLTVLLASSCSRDSRTAAATVPENLPPGSGVRAIEMRGTWEITDASVRVWNPFSPLGVQGPVGSTFVIAPHPTLPEMNELAAFAWYVPVPGALGAGAPWRTNVGDGMVLAYDRLFFGLAPGGGTLTHFLDIEVGSIGPDVVVGYYGESHVVQPGVPSSVEFSFEAARVN